MFVVSSLPCPFTVRSQINTFL